MNETIPNTEVPHEQAHIHTWQSRGSRIFADKPGAPPYIQENFTPLYWCSVCGAIRSRVRSEDVSETIQWPEVSR